MLALKLVTVLCEGQGGGLSAVNGDGGRSGLLALQSVPRSIGGHPPLLQQESCQKDFQGKLSKAPKSVSNKGHPPIHPSPPKIAVSIVWSLLFSQLSEMSRFPHKFAIPSLIVFPCIFCRTLSFCWSDDHDDYDDQNGLVMKCHLVINITQ